MAGGEHAANPFLALCIVYIAALIGGELAQRIKLPAVVGEIAAGALIGPSVLGWIHVDEPLHLLAELGAVLLLFSVGLETRLDELKAVGPISLKVGALGVLAPFVLAITWATLSGYDTPQAMFVAVAFVATSVGITARVLQDMGQLGRLESRVILGAAVIDDILAMLLLGIVTAFQSGSQPTVLGVVWVIVQAVGFVVLVALIGGKVMRRSSDALEAPINPLSPLTICLAICLALAATATSIGLAAIIGAFLAGMVAAEADQRHDLVDRTHALTALLVPFFFVATGAQVDLSQLGSASALLTVGLLVVLAVAGKFIGCGFGALSLGRPHAAIVGVGMVPQGEVGIIIASLGMQAGAFDARTYALLVGMILTTSIVGPPVLGYLVGRTPPPAGEVGGGTPEAAVT